MNHPTIVQASVFYASGAGGLEHRLEDLGSRTAIFFLRSM